MYVHSLYEFCYRSYIQWECHSVLAKLHPITFCRGVRGSWAECHFLFSLVYQLCLALWWKSNTRMLVTFGICFKHFDTRYLVFYNTSPPRMFLSLDLLWEYRIQHGTNGPLYVTSSYSTWIFCRGVSGFATDCPCGVWCRGFIFFMFWHMQLYVLMHQIIFGFTFLNIIYFFKYSCTNIFHKRSLHTFYTANTSRARPW